MARRSTVDPAAPPEGDAPAEGAPLEDAAPAEGAPLDDGAAALAAALEAAGGDLELADRILAGDLVVSSEVLDEPEVEHVATLADADPGLGVFVALGVEHMSRDGREWIVDPATGLIVAELVDGEPVTEGNA